MLNTVNFLLIISCVILLLSALILLLWTLFLFNSLVKLQNIVKEAWSGIDVQLKRRYDLIPSLVEVVKGFAKHEKSTFEKVTELRSKAMNSTNVSEKEEIENQIAYSLKSIFAVAENYPELKSNENFLKLQEDLSEIEDELQKSRRYYNGTVRDINTKIQSFPASLIASVLGFKEKRFFQASEEEKENVMVNLDS